ncbi:proline-specific peptidase [Mollisia scopiformis]|uniref:Proline-specific peptidase n=1 Tax=Mollisia scopiformis TaxID=149040 RepID=A0A194XNA0_MOLSC|nr:proline-specific peptidase [Mollisia scopiformis]KUJ21574.1 proline-specific peptidase [Mollisia scopiformis]
MAENIQRIQISSKTEADFDYPSANKPCKTGYKIISPAVTDSSRIPLICIHGGLGMTHHYLSTHSILTEKYGIPVIFYDQIGCGFSTHLPEKSIDQIFWTEDLFIAELENLIAHLNLKEYDILGSSWGGMMSSRFASRRPAGLRKLILANAPADMNLRHESAREYCLDLPQDIQEILLKHEKAKTEDSKECNEAYLEFPGHVCNIYPFPPELVASLQHATDRTAVMAMEGTGKFKYDGALAEWSMIGEAKKIQVPTLLINGNKEIASDKAVTPFWKDIRKVKWVKMMNSTHSPHLEEKERYMEIVGEFLTEQ